MQCTHAIVPWVAGMRDQWPQNRQRFRILLVVFGQMAHMQELQKPLFPRSADSAPGPRK